MGLAPRCSLPADVHPLLSKNFLVDTHSTVLRHQGSQPTSQLAFDHLDAEVQTASRQHGASSSEARTLHTGGDHARSRTACRWRPLQLRIAAPREYAMSRRESDGGPCTALCISDALARKGRATPRGPSGRSAALRMATVSPAATARKLVSDQRIAFGRLTGRHKGPCTAASWPVNVAGASTLLSPLVLAMRELPGLNSPARSSIRRPREPTADSSFCCS
mmetsp:Transcript_38171/g.96641  ORF Transcript_38171/g.96641 Transcript_38171/m.96641 type:complete len:220 (+) Transcript_38171:2647-3306(+)